MKKIFAVIMVLVLSVVSVSVFAEGEKQFDTANCAKIKETLVNLQHTDSRARVYLGRYYETILNQFIVPLNMRLVENNISSSGLVDIQGKFKASRQDFIDHYIAYQQSLEELVGVNCAEEPEKFLQKLDDTRKTQQVVAGDVVKLRELMGKQVELVQNLMGEIK